MSDSEQRRLRTAIAMLAYENRWDQAMEILFPMAGLGEYPLPKVVSVDVRDVAAQQIPVETGTETKL